MENKAKLQKLLLAEQEDLQKILDLVLPEFDAGRELGNLIKGDADLSDSQTFLNVKKHGTKAANSLKGAQTSAKFALQAVEDALIRVGK
ncbi:hypothetical protein [Lactococcus lactis]|uniref:Uncharacterized protein n=1 Tax=Lactococcus lactis subsp. lactis A12 TaxID=1137134 RepID=S6FEP6_LACLL|nr:hypothetical protein [Lactococcus lactis]CDG03746.1 Putative uncharacterized protein [Lactococcus lactis subsp. lactis A12]SBW29601.1 Hypothetical protein LLA12_00426 [Lactococcus lactis subsp. lactis]